MAANRTAATKEESIKIIKQMYRTRLKKKGIDPEEKWLNEKAEQMYLENPDAIHKLEE
jgi:hypothetical protein